MCTVKISYCNLCYIKILEKINFIWFLVVMQYFDRKLVETGIKLYFNFDGNFIIIYDYNYNTLY